LENIKRQGKVLIIREVTDDYWAPLGVWVVRETVRGAFDNEYGVVEDLNTALNNIRRQVSVDWDRIRRKSKMIQGMQSSLSQFL
jgi:hypothetical protein